MYVEHTCPTPWSSFDEMSMMLKVPISEVWNGTFAGDADGTAEQTQLEMVSMTRRCATLYLEFDTFEAPICGIRLSPRPIMSHEKLQKRWIQTRIALSRRQSLSSSSGYLTKTLQSTVTMWRHEAPPLVCTVSMILIMRRPGHRKVRFEFEKKSQHLGGGAAHFGCAPVTGKLSWYDSKRSDAKLLGQQDPRGQC